VDSEWDYDTGWLTVEAEVNGRPGWLVKGVFRPDGVGFVLAEVRVGPSGDEVPAGGVQAELMRDVRLNDLHAGLATEGPVYARVGSGALSVKPSPALAEELQRLAYRMGAGARSARSLDGAATLARWAARYVEAMATSSTPIAALAKRHRLSRKQVSNLIEQARRAELLSRPGKGSARGGLTARAVEILKEVEHGKHREEA
jgi:hypothetical protein